MSVGHKLGVRLMAHDYANLLLAQADYLVGLLRDGLATPIDDVQP
jgi:hypothetical protein